MRPEHPPGCTATRRRRSSRPSCSHSERTLLAAVSLRLTPCAAFSVMVSLMAFSSISYVLLLTECTRVEATQQDRLGVNRAREHPQVEGLVGAMSASVGVFDARHQDLCLRELLHEI